MYTPYGDSVLAKKVYRSYLMSVFHKVISSDLIKLDMINFNIILDMDMCHASYASIDYRTHKVNFQFPNEPTLKWKGCDTMVRDQFIFHLKAYRIISNGFIYHIVEVRDLNSEAFTLELVPIINEFLQYISFDDLPSIPLGNKIYLGVHLLPDTRSISIPPYRMSLVELNELKK